VRGRQELNNKNSTWKGVFGMADLRKRLDASLESLAVLIQHKMKHHASSSPGTASLRNDKKADL
jgi:hypothetical protein